MTYRKIRELIAALPEPKPRVTFATTDPERLAQFERVRPFVEAIALDVQRYVMHARTHYLLYGLCLVCGEAHDFTKHTPEECAAAAPR